MAANDFSIHSTAELMAYLFQNFEIKFSRMDNIIETRIELVIGK
jgi:hypothetical protein